jgi:hypothetical protein
MPSTHPAKTGAAAAFAGVILLFAGTLLHPSHAHPNDAAAAFAEYAADQHWVASHLAQLFGALLLFAALLLLARLLQTAASQSAGRIGSLLAIASASTAAGLQAVDGIALRNMTTAWASAEASDKAVWFAATYATRQIEIGLAAIFGLLGGVTVIVFGIALLADRQFPRGLAWGALPCGAATAAGGLAMAYTGFSDTAMEINMPANIVLLLWAIALGAWMWRHQTIR